MFAVFVWTGALVLGSELVLLLVRARADRLHLSTGAARWIWATRDLPEPAPLSFTAVKDFVATPSPRPALARIFVDRSYSFRVNGVPVGSGSQKPGDSLHVYDLSSVLRPGRNHIAVVASSPTGAGGILFWLDAGDRQPVVSDDSWEIESAAEVSGKSPRRAVQWGRPPMYPWRYPPLPAESAGRSGSAGNAPETSMPSPARAAAQYGLSLSYPASTITLR